jgi:predicted nucleic acid-binding protein
LIVFFDDSGAVEACLLHGLKRRAVGLFKTSTTMALLQKIAKSCPAAAEVVKIADDDHRHSEESTNIFSFSKYDRSILTQFLLISRFF